MRFSRKFTRNFAKAFSNGFAGSSGGLFSYLKNLYYQYLFPAKSDQIYQDGTDILAKNYGTGDVDGLIGNVQVATFDGTSYLTFIDLAGATIVSSFGTSTPTKINDQRIDFTAGTCWGLFLSNGSFIPMCEGQGSTHYDRKGLHDATIVGATLSVHHGTKSNEALPYMFIYGGSQYLVCKTSGTTTHFAMPDGSNIGSEVIINGGFDTDSNWTKSTGWTIEDGVLRVNATNGSITYQNNSGIISGKTYLVSWNISNYVSGSIRIVIGGIVLSSLKDSSGTEYVVAGATAQVAMVGIGTSVIMDIDNVSVKEVTTIDLTAQGNVWSAKVKPVGVIDWYFVNSTDNTLGNGYMLRITPTAITLYRNDAGSLVQLDTKSMTINNYDEITITNLTVKVNGVEQLTSSDSTYTTMQTMTIDADADDELLNIYYNNKRFDPYEFIDNTGVYGIQNVINVEV